MLTALAASASRKPTGTPQTLLLAVPHPIGGPRHLIAVYFEAALADHLRHLVATRTGPILTFDKARLDRATPLKWCYVSDEREEVTKRRDIGRPVIAYQGKNVLIWGVGGLGSWIAEYITRAGAKKVTVCDNGIVTGGLLVRQNYADLDVGASKADRLAERLRAITYETIIESRHNIDDDELQALATTADLIIDATINRVVTRRLETLTNKPNRTAVIAQVATDARTGCLGIAMVYGSGQPAGILETDVNTGHVVEADPALEPYQVFWKDPEPGDEFVPTRGCSPAHIPRISCRPRSRRSQSHKPHRAPPDRQRQRHTPVRSPTLRCHSALPIHKAPGRGDRHQLTPSRTSARDLIRGLAHSGPV